MLVALLWIESCNREQRVSVVGCRASRMTRDRLARDRGVAPRGDVGFDPSIRHRVPRIDWGCSGGSNVGHFTRK